MSNEIPTSICDLSHSIPSADVIRQKIEEKRRESQFLRRLLKLAVEAEKVTQREGQAGE